MKLTKFIIAYVAGVESEEVNDFQVNRLQFMSSGGTRSYSMRRDMITAQLAARNVPYFYHHFHDYGCYCIAQNLETNPLKNRGRPLDDVDAICQAHSKCQQCVYADSNGSINPKSTGYQMTVDRNSGDIVCQGKSAYPKKFQQNGTWEARYNACLCDRELAIGLAEMAVQQRYNKEYENHDGSQCGIKTKPVRAQASLNADTSNLQMNPVMNAAFEEGPTDIKLLGESSFETVGKGKDIFVSENVGQCCGTYPKRVPIPHYGKIGASQCCDGELRPNGSC